MVKLETKGNFGAFCNPTLVWFAGIMSTLLASQLYSIRPALQGYFGTVVGFQLLGVAIGLTFALRKRAYAKPSTVPTHIPKLALFQYWLVAIWLCSFVPFSFIEDAESKENAVVAREILVDMIRTGEYGIYNLDRLIAEASYSGYTNYDVYYLLLLGGLALFHSFYWARKSVPTSSEM